METKFNFKSAICTSRSQSERLLALGLKKETADMCWQTMTLNGEAITYPSQDVWMNGSIITNNHFPAWSLHRLMILAEMKGTAFLDLDSAYEATISIIATEIRFGYFNEEYLEE